MTRASPEVTRARRETKRGILILCGVVVILYGDLLFFPGDRVISHVGGDTALNHVFLRSYGVEEIRQGNLPLWNPMLFSGTPFLGSMQAALLYPPNVTYLFLPIQKAINVDLAGHLLLLGVFTFLWLRYWRLHWLAALYGALVVMFGGATYLRVLAGQINVIATYAWAPLLLLAVDHIIDRPRDERFPSPWCLVGVGATTLLVLAGYPQALFICTFTIGLYTVIRLARAHHRRLSIPELVIVALLPAFLSSIQLWTGVAAGLESTRGEQIPYDFASSFSFPPENLLTSITPSLFGDVVREAYWGRWAFWDASLFVGFGSVVFAVLGALQGRALLRWVSITLAALTIVIALGKYTPIHAWLFEYVPGFGQFRAPSKFLFFSSFFIAVLGALGCDVLLKFPRPARALVWPAAVVATGLLGVGVFLSATDSAQTGHPWNDLLMHMKSIDDTKIWFDITDKYARDSARLAAFSLLASAVVGFALAAMLWLSATGAQWRYGAILLSIVELAGFAIAYRSSFSLDRLDRPVLRSLDPAVRAGGRVYPVVGYDNGVSNFLVDLRIPSVWGYDPLILGRYGELMSLATGGLPDAPRIREDVFVWAADPLGAAIRLGLVNATETSLTTDPKLFRLLQCTMIVRPVITEKYLSLLKFIRLRDRRGLQTLFAVPEDRHAVYVIPDPLPRFNFFSEYAVADSIQDVMDRLGAREFDPARTLVLEEEPVPAPAPRLAHATLEIVDESTDHITVHATLTEPAILLITDAYAKGWRAISLAGSTQSEYQLLPADLALRAIPLSAGEHHFRVEYAPSAYRYALIATPIAASSFAALAFLCWFRRGASATAPES